MRSRTSVAVVLAVGLVVMAAARRQPASEDIYTREFRLQSLHLIPIGANPYMTLQAGKFWRYEGQDGADTVSMEVRVLPEVRWVSFPVNGFTKWALTRVVEEREWVNDELVRLSRRFIARDLKTANMFSLGEEVNLHSGGQFAGNDGSWLAGVDGARPGMAMPAQFMLGSRYVQQLAPGVAMDRAEHVDMNETIQTPAGTFHACVVVRESTPLDPDAEGFKVYAPMVGMVQDGFLQLVEHN